MALRAFRYWWLRYRRTWRGTIVISVANPLLFLVAFAVGLGQLVQGDYLAFFAPGMLAAASMQNGIVESAFPVSRSRMPDGAYRVALATPLSPADLLHGHLMFMTLRIFLSAAAFFGVMLAFGVATSATVVWALPAATLTGVAFALPTAAWAVTLRTPEPVMALFKWVVMPLYLFSGTFFPVSQLPSALQRVVEVSPLWHGAELCRSLTHGTASVVDSAVHIGYLAALAGAGYLLARRNFGRSLCT